MTPLQYKIDSTWRVYVLLLNARDPWDQYPWYAYGLSHTVDMLILLGQVP